MLEKILLFLFGDKMLKELSKRFTAFVVSILTIAAPELAKIGLKININPEEFLIWVVGVLTAFIAYVTAETKRASAKK